MCSWVCTLHPPILVSQVWYWLFLPGLSCPLYLGPEPHLELVQQFCHLVHQMLFYALVVAPLVLVSAQLRFHLGGGTDTKYQVLASWGRGHWLTYHPDYPSMQSLGGCETGGEPVSLSCHLLSFFFQVSAPLPPPTGNRPPTAQNHTQTPTPGSLTPLDSSLQPILGGHCRSVSCTTV